MKELLERDPAAAARVLSEFSQQHWLLCSAARRVLYGFGGLLSRAVCFPSSQRQAVGGWLDRPAPIV